MQFGGIHAVSGVSLRVGHGEIVGVIGPNGAGKTTLLNAISRIVRSTGAVSFNGGRTDGLPPNRLRPLGIGRSFQHPQLDPKLTLAQNVATGVAFERQYGWLAAGFTWPTMRRREASIGRAVGEVGAEFGISHWLRRRAEDAPHGIQKMADIARATLCGPKLVLLDEPFAALTGEEKRKLTTALTNQRDRKMTSVLIIDHDVELVTEFCDRLYAMNMGTIVASGLPEDVVRDESVMTSYLGERPHA